MHTRAYTVTGSGVTELERILSSRLNPEELHSGEGFAIMMLEEYEFFQTSSNMQATVIVDHQSEDTARVKVVVGGGSVSPFQVNVGGESKVNEAVRERVTDVFETLDLTVDSDVDQTGTEKFSHWGGDGD